MVFPLLMTMSIVALVVIAGKQRKINEKLKSIEKRLEYYIENNGKENQNKETEGTTGDNAG